MTPWWEEPPRRPDAEAERAAEARQGQLTKPPGSLGRLEGLAVRLAALQGTFAPAVDPAAVTVFAADHGVVAEGISAFPQAVTVEMIRNFSRGGAAIAVLARAAAARLEVVNCGTAAGHEALDGVIYDPAGPGTRNLCTEAAMDGGQLEHCLALGRGAVERAATAGCRVFIGGEMGIGNTTAATALACALTGVPPVELAGPGTGLDAAGVERKRAVIERALVLHRGALEDPLEALRRLGGFEIAALAGAYLAAGRQGLPVLVDGFISTAAALTACRLQPKLSPWLVFAHRSAEPGHDRLLSALAAAPLLDLGMRLGEGSGAAVALGVLRDACALHNGMATFAEAGVSEGP